MKCLAIIPARGGSKRIPKKNIKPFLGKPIIAYTLETAIQSGLFEEVMVSTDDDEVARISQKYHASVPFMRSKETANDTAPLVAVLIEVLTAYQQLGKTFDAICCLLPTAPLLSISTLQASYNKLAQSTFDSICPVVEFSYPIMRSLKLDEQQHLQFNWPEYQFTRSQDIPPAYHDCGLFYWLRTEALLRDKQIMTPRGSAVVLSEMEAQDIDTLMDWQLAELKYKMGHSK